MVSSFIYFEDLYCVLQSEWGIVMYKIVTLNMQTEDKKMYDSELNSNVHFHEKSCYLVR
jgi:hypothetical protein